MNELTDEELYEKFLNGNEDNAYDVIYKRYHADLVKRVYKHLRNTETAEDIVQDAFSYILVNSGKKDGHKSLKNYLYLIADHRTINYINKHKLEKEFMDIDEYDGGKDNFDNILQKLDLELVDKQIETLKPKQRTAMILVCKQGYSYKQAARIMEETEDNIKYYIRKGRDKIIEGAGDRLNHVICRKRVHVLKTILLTILVGTLVAGTIYAAYKIVETINKAPEHFTVDAEKEGRTEKYIDNNERAKKVLDEFCNKMGYHYNTHTITTYSSAKLDKEYFRIKTDEFYIDIDAETYKLVVFEKSNLKESIEDFNEGELIKLAKKLNDKFETYKEYKLGRINKVCIDKLNFVKATFMKEYDGIYNRYQSITYVFVPKTEEIYQIFVVDEPFSNNPIKITEEESGMIVRNDDYFKDKKLLNINKVELGIEKLNYDLYYQKYGNLKEEFYKTSDIVRKVWKVHIEFKENNLTIHQIVYVDCTTGEIIGMFE